ncbi:MAG TPA: polysaccharide deacetylase family protein, partial [Polyangia bacterium]
MTPDAYRTPIIFMYHSVRAAENGGAYGIEIAPDRFARHVAFLSSHYRIVPLIEFVDALTSRARSDGMAAITFDDAFEDNLTVAADILRKYATPATVFVPTGFIGR